MHYVTESVLDNSHNLYSALGRVNHIMIKSLTLTDSSLSSSISAKETIDDQVNLMVVNYLLRFAEVLPSLVKYWGLKLNTLWTALSSRYPTATTLNTRKTSQGHRQRKMSPLECFIAQETGDRTWIRDTISLDSPSTQRVFEKSCL